MSKREIGGRTLVEPSRVSLFEPEQSAAGADARFVRVVVERGIDSADLLAGLTYRCDDSSVQVGDRVSVPLGRGDKPAGGVVIGAGGAELLEGLKASRVKQVLGVSGGRLTPALVELGRWMAGYYVCPLGLVLAAMVPAAVKKATGKKTEFWIQRPMASADPGPPARATRRLMERIGAIDAGDFPMSVRDLAGRVGMKTTAPLTRLVKLGLLATVEHSRVDARGAVTPEEGPPTGALALSSDQERAVEGISATAGGFAVHLLRGVTGSGKTEVYLRAIERVLQTGKGAIVLVPEIALTPQTSQRFLERFAHAGVAVMHSGLTASQRHAEWDRIARGTARVVVGARSAVFAPVPAVGIIVVDEEHDGSYKQDQAPRYHARDGAVKRAQIENCPVVLGSATPALESWANCVGENPKYRLWELPRRVGGRGLPPVEIVDLVEERRERAREDPLSLRRQWAIGPRLERAIGETLAAGGQVILLLNRRGFAHYIACPDPRCGWVLTCEQCDAGMVFHKDATLRRGGDAACHHCLARCLVPAMCPACTKPVNTFGVGTQRLEEELVRIFGVSHGLDEKTMHRVDSDSMGSARDYFDVLGRFGRGDVRVLLGTQMIAKGLDFPNVRLVGVVSADTGLLVPDFRAAERTFQLVSQVAGRAGRGTQGGRVIVQTMEPSNPAICLAARHDYVGFAARELSIRNRSGLPPAARMARVVSRHEDAEKARGAAAEIAAALRRAAGEAVTVTGPMVCPMARLDGRFRFAVEAVARKAGELQRCLAAARSAGLLTSDERTAVDVDPVVLM